MSADDFGGTLPMSMWSNYIGASSHFPLVAHGSGPKEGSKLSRHVSWHRHSGPLCPQAVIYSQGPPEIIYTPPAVETNPDPNEKAPDVQSASNLSESHDCQSCYLSYGSNLHNTSGYPTKSVDHDPLLEPQQCSPASDGPQSDSSRDDEFPLYGSQNLRPAFHLTKDSDALLSNISSLERGMGSPPLSESSSGVSIPERGQIPGPPASVSPAENTVHFLRSREDQQYREAWAPAIESTFTPVGTIRYQDNVGGAIISFAPQESNHQAPYKPRYTQRHRPVPPPFIDISSPSSRSSPAYVGSFPAASPPVQETLHHPSRYTKNRPEKKYRCSSSGCGAEFSHPQALGRHVKDTHKAKIPCIHCASFSWPQGRRYLYLRHVIMQHPQITPPNVRRRVKIREPS